MSKLKNKFKKNSYQKLSNEDPDDLDFPKRMVSNTTKPKKPAAAKPKKKPAAKPKPKAKPVKKKPKKKPVRRYESSDSDSDYSSSSYSSDSDSEDDIRAAYLENYRQALKDGNFAIIQNILADTSRWQVPLPRMENKLKAALYIYLQKILNRKEYHQLISLTQFLKSQKITLDLEITRELYLQVDQNILQSLTESGYIHLKMSSPLFMTATDQAPGTVMRLIQRGMQPPQLKPKQTEVLFKTLVKLQTDPQGRHRQEAANLMTYLMQKDILKRDQLPRYFRLAVEMDQPELANYLSQQLNQEGNTNGQPPLTPGHYGYLLAHMLYNGHKIPDQIISMLMKQQINPNYLYLPGKIHLGHSRLYPSNAQDVAKSPIVATKDVWQFAKNPPNSTGNQSTASTTNKLSKSINPQHPVPPTPKPTPKSGGVDWRSWNPKTGGNPVNKKKVIGPANKATIPRNAGTATGTPNGKKKIKKKTNKNNNNNDDDDDGGSAEVYPLWYLFYQQPELRPWAKWLFKHPDFDLNFYSKEVEPPAVLVQRYRDPESLNILTERPDLQISWNDNQLLRTAQKEGDKELMEHLKEHPNFFMTPNSHDLAVDDPTPALMDFFTSDICKTETPVGTTTETVAAAAQTEELLPEVTAEEEVHEPIAQEQEQVSQEAIKTELDQALLTSQNKLLEAFAQESPTNVEAPSMPADYSVLPATTSDSLYPVVLQPINQQSQYQSQSQSARMNPFTQLEPAPVVEAANPPSHVIGNPPPRVVGNPPPRVVGPQAYPSDHQLVMAQPTPAPVQQEGFGYIQPPQQVTAPQPRLNVSAFPNVTALPLPGPTSQQVVKAPPPAYREKVALTG